jgi:hypothetical protein
VGGCAAGGHEAEEGLAERGQVVPRCVHRIWWRRRARGQQF